MSTVIKLTDDASKYCITRRAFRDRFTFVERTAIEAAANTDTEVKVLLKDQDSSAYVDLTHDMTTAGIQLLVSKSLITPERGELILSAEVLPGEVFRGGSQ